MKFPRAALVRCRDHIKKIYKLYGDQAVSLDADECSTALLQNEVWVAGACWDLKCVAGVFYSHLLNDDSLKLKNIKCSHQVANQKVQVQN